MNPEEKEKETLIDETFEKIFIGPDTDLPVNMISVEWCDLDTPDPKLVTLHLSFDHFHRAWFYIFKNKDVIAGLTNPTIKPFHEIEEQPTLERAERLKRYADYILEKEEKK